MLIFGRRFGRNSSVNGTRSGDFLKHPAGHKDHHADQGKFKEKTHVSVLKGRDNKHIQYQKEADEHLDALPGELSVRAALVKAVQGIPDEAVREKAGQVLIAGNKAMKAAFNTVGSGGSGVEPGSTAHEMDRLTKSFMKAHPDSTEENAYGEVLLANPVLAAKVIDEG